MGEMGEIDFSPSPVMTFQVAGEWLAVRIDQLDRIALASRLWPVPMTRPDYVGLLDDGRELVPVLELGSESKPSTPAIEPMVAILRVRDQAVGLAIQRAGRVIHSYRIHDDAPASLPVALQQAEPRRASSADRQFWLINADQLWAA